MLIILTTGFFFHNEKTFINKFEAGSYNFRVYQLEKMRAFYVKYADIYLKETVI